MTQWATGQKAEMEQEGIDRVLFELASDWMSVSKLRMLPGYVAKESDAALWAKQSDAALWKKFRQHPRRSSTVKNSPTTAKIPVDTAQSDQIMGCSHLPERFSSWA